MSLLTPYVCFKELCTFCCSFVEHGEETVPDPAPDLDVDPDKTPTNQKKKRRRSAVDVKKWLLRKPSTNRKKKEQDRKSFLAESGKRLKFKGD